MKWLFQSWDTANKATGIERLQRLHHLGPEGQKHIYLCCMYFDGAWITLALKRAVEEQAVAHQAERTIIIEDKASGTQLIQELVHGGVHGVQRYEPNMDKKFMRMHNGFSQFY